MATKTVQYLLKRLSLSRKRTKKTGFTLLELLIAMLISTIIITGVLDLVVSVLRDDRREYAQSETQREMQMALNFITDDLREAVYIYDQVEQPRNGFNPLKTYIPNIANPGSDSPVPVLAFWKAERLPYSSNQSLPTSCSATDTECNQLLIRRRTYSLVVYYVAKNQNNDSKWKGKARIIRYVFRKYQNLPSLTWTQGYRDPAEQSSFENWPYQNGNDSVTAPAGGAGTMTAVLVDFVDDPANTVPTDACPGDNIVTPTHPEPDYRRVPATSTPPSNSTSFYVCVKTLGITQGTSLEEKLNQDVYVYLRGNPIGKVNANDVRPLSTLKAGAIARGVIDKQP